MTKSILAIDLATTTGWAVHSCNVVTSGTISFKGSRFEGGGMRFLRFRCWFTQMVALQKPEVVVYEAVRRHLGTDAAHVYGGLLATMQAICEDKEIPYEGFGVAEIKIAATGKGNAKKDAMISAATARWPDQDIIDDNQADALWIMQLGVLRHSDPAAPAIRARQGHRRTCKKPGASGASSL